MRPLILGALTVGIAAGVVAMSHVPQALDPHAAPRVVAPEAAPLPRSTPRLVSSARLQKLLWTTRHDYSMLHNRAFRI